MTAKLLCVAMAITVALPGCGPRRETVQRDEPELPTLDVTHWTNATELFMEHPPLVAGRAALFAVHLTKLADFTPVDAGRAKIEFTPESGGQPKEMVSPPPSRPGAFRIEEVPPQPGRYRWALVLEAPGLTDRHELGTVTVFRDAAEAQAEAAHTPTEDAAAIAFLKEQQWTGDFATGLVEEAEIRDAIRAPATVHPLPGGEAVVAAPSAGRFTAEKLLSIGDRVRAGQVLGRLEPRLSAGADHATLEADVAEARAATDAARVEQRRAERLLEERAIPARRLEDARRAVGVAEARLKAAEARLNERDEALRTGGGAAAGNAFTLRAPISGRLAEVMATLGASYDAGVQLFRVVRTDRVELEVQIPTADVPAARQTVGVSLEIPGQAPPLELEAHHVHDSGVIDPATRALALKMEVENPKERLLVGQVGTALLYGRDRRRLPTVPSTAVLTESGRSYVFVQVGGETFARRFIALAGRDGDRMGVTHGVAVGDRVVIRGAYDIHLASAASGLPEAGHVH
jgi:RND family efflux transporter MFP subunit